MKIAILISGRGSNMAALAENRQGFEICLVAADRPAAGLETAQKNGHRTALIDRKKYPAKQSHEAALADAIAAHDPDWIILAGYMSVLSETFISRFDGRVLNIHPSLLPDYKGLNTHARVLADKKTHHGVSVHLVTAALDDGPLLAQMKLAVAPNDTETSLSERVLALEHQLYPAVITALAEDFVHVEGLNVRWSDTSRLRSITGGVVCFPPLD